MSPLFCCSGRHSIATGGVSLQFTGRRRRRRLWLLSPQRTSCDSRTHRGETASEHFPPSCALAVLQTCVFCARIQKDRRAVCRSAPPWEHILRPTEQNGALARSKGTRGTAPPLQSIEIAGCERGFHGFIHLQEAAAAIGAAAFVALTAKR
jgi:hypothetical protein